MARLLRLACRGISNADQASITDASHELFGSVRDQLNLIRSTLEQIEGGAPDVIDV